MKLTDYGMDAALDRADGQIQHWTKRVLYATTMPETLMMEAAKESWNQVARAVSACRAMRPSTVQAAGEVAARQLHELERLRGQGEGPVDTLNQAILAAEEACTLITEILDQTEGDAP